jgi:FtsZ-binding cell division protein ZapB
MVAQYYGKDWNPVRINDDLKKMGAGVGFQAGSGNYIPGGFNKLFGDIKEIRTMTPTRMTDAQIGEIKSSIDSGHPVMVQIDVNPRTVENDTHFVLIIGYDPTSENNFTIADPLGGKIRSLKDYLGWYFPNARDTIFQYTRYEGKRPNPNSPEMITVGKDQWDTMRMNHDKWHELVNYLSEGSNPNTTAFDQIRSIIGGIKSRASDMENQRNDANNKLAIAQQEIKNRIEQVGRLEQELLKQQKDYEDRLKALNDSMPNIDLIRGQYEGEILKLKTEIDDLSKEKGRLLNQLAECQNGQTSNSGLVIAVQAIVNWFKNNIKV